MVIPRAIREQVGLGAGEVEVTVDGSGVRIEPVAGEGLTEVGGRLVIPASGAGIDDALVRALRDAGQR